MELKSDSAPLCSAPRGRLDDDGVLDNSFSWHFRGGLFFLYLKKGLQNNGVGLVQVHRDSNSFF